MQSVSSNAVYNETRLVDGYEQTDYQIYKVGRICFCHVGFTATPHTTPIVLATVPDKYKPYYHVRSIWFDNGDDSYGGQLVLDLTGNLNVWNGGGGAFTQNIAVESTFVYLSAS